MAPPGPQLQPLLALLVALVLLHPCLLHVARAEAAPAAQSSSSSSALPAVCAAAPLSVPRVPSRDQSPTPQNLLGRCTERVEAHTRMTSSWCRAPELSVFTPSAAAATTTSAASTTTTTTTTARPLAAEACTKRGRMTVYRGPVLGYDDDNSHVGACNATLAGTNTHALVAVSTAHLSSRQGAWEPTPGACGSCMCVRVAGADSGMNPSVESMYGPNVAGALGASFMAVVGDRCGECEDEHIDLLLDRPLSFAPYDRSIPDGQDQARAQAAATRPGAAIPPVRPTNRRAPLVNRLKGPRVFSASASLRGQGRGAPEAVGVYVADWQWVPCEWTHAQCAAMWRRLGFNGLAWAPPVRSGVDSDTGADVASPGEDGSFCCGEAEPGVVVPEVSDALPEGVRAAVSAAASSSAASSSSAADEAAVAASAALAASWAAGTSGGGGGSATGQQQQGQKEEEEEQPMYNAAEEFAASFATSSPSLLAARTQRSPSSPLPSSSASGAKLLAAGRSTAARGGLPGQGNALPSSDVSSGKTAGIAVGAVVGLAAMGGAVWVFVRRRRAAAAAAEAGAAATGAAAPGGKKNKGGGGAPAFVMPPPPASGNGAEMGGR